MAPGRLGGALEALVGDLKGEGEGAALRLEISVRSSYEVPSSRGPGKCGAVQKVLFVVNSWLDGWARTGRRQTEMAWTALGGRCLGMTGQLKRCEPRCCHACTAQVLRRGHHKAHAACAAIQPARL